MLKELKEQLFDLRDIKYREFSSSLLPNVDNIIGVRLPVLNKIAKNLVKSKKSVDFLCENDDEFMELTLLEGMVISLCDCDYNKKIKLVEKFVPKITNWSVCDSFCARLKFISNNKRNFKKFLEKYFNSKSEFELRFAYVILLNYYIQDDLDYVLDKIKIFKDSAYYSKMGCAWLLSYCFIYNFEKTFDFLSKNKIHEFVIKKGIQKSVESYRLTKEQKQILKNHTF